MIVAGGIGLAPLRPVVYEVLSARERFGRALRCCTAAASPSSCSYASRARGVAARGLEVEVTVDIATGWMAREGREWCRR